MAKRTVTKKAPTKPSTVFFGLSLMSWCRPNSMPHTYAATSFMMTSETGTQNQIMPCARARSVRLKEGEDRRRGEGRTSRMLSTIKWLETTMRRSDMWIHPNRPNWRRRLLRFRVATKLTNPARARARVTASVQRSLKNGERVGTHR